VDNLGFDVFSFKSRAENVQKVMRTDEIKKRFDALKEEYDVIFVDPPYNIGLSDRALKQIGQQPVLAKTGVVVLECAREEDKPQEEGNLILRRRYDYGTVSVLIYVRKDREEA
jgi:16S rRNA G966 N2-methylase RsmD